MLFGFLAAATTPRRAGDGHPHPAAAPDRAGRQAGRGGGRALRRAPAARRGGGLEPVEFEALGEDFTTRGRRDRGAGRRDARALDAGAGHVQGRATTRSPMPASTRFRCSGPFPSGWAGRANRCSSAWRRIADGWMPHFRPGGAGPGDGGSAARDDSRGRTRPEGLRNRGSHGAAPDPARRTGARSWRPGAPCAGSRISAFHTAGMGLATPDDHVKTLRRFRETVGLG